MNELDRIKQNLAAIGSRLLQRMANTGKRLVVMLKKSADLAVKNAKSRILASRLNSADEATGRKAHDQQVGEQLFSETYGRIRVIDEQLAAKRKTGPTSTKTMSEKAKWISFEVGKSVAIAVLLLKRKKCLRDLGSKLRSNVEASDTQFVREELLHARSVQSSFETLNDEIAILSSQNPGLLRKVMAGIVLVAVVLLLSMGYSSRPSEELGNVSESQSPKDLKRGKSDGDNKTSNESPTSKIDFQRVSTTSSDQSEPVEERVRAIDILSKGVARKVLDSPRWAEIDLTKYKRIDGEAAELLADYKGNLQLDGITDLSTYEADCLAKHVGKVLCLNGLKSLTDFVAESLSKHHGNLELNGLQALTPSACKALAPHKGWIVLKQLSTISPEVANALIRTQSEVDLSGVSTLSVPALQCLVKCQNTIVMGGIHELPDNLADVLAKDRHRVQLVHLKKLSARAAAGVAQYEDGTLDLNELQTIDVSAAANVARHKPNKHSRQRFLELNGLTELTKEVAAALATHGNGTGKHEELRLSGVTSITPDVAAALSRHTGTIRLGITSCTPEVAERLAMQNGSLELDRLSGMGSATAKAFAKHKGSLSFRALKTLTEDEARELAAFKGFLSLTGLTKLNDAAAAELAQHTGGLFLNTDNTSLKKQIEKFR